MLTLNSHVQIPLTEFSFTFARSSGPGGQNVNKVNSKAILRWAVAISPSLPPGPRQRFLTKYASRITLDGELILSSQKYRDQSRNIDDCLEKLHEMLMSIISPPPVRRAVKISKAVKARRSEAKRENSQKKQQRRRPERED
ncbi:MAG: aminoacyl-tRNA hydrolase [Candidatus Obscuribacterales bacterium]|nr:aminoacyl-tRNA hydrolase [Candidatus Obscuribacterales bacterium]